MRPSKKLPAAFVRNLKKITAKRARRVIDHILKHGHVTTEELKQKYGYNHPPRGAQDVKDLGVPIRMFRVKATDGSSAAAYEFGDPAKARFGQLRGRSALGKQLKADLIAAQGERCAITGAALGSSELQIDHRVPYQIGGDAKGTPKVACYMLLSRGANRAKSWACEHCPNFLVEKNPKVCGSCYWAFPDAYSHVATRSERRLDLVWQGDEVTVVQTLEKLAKANKVPTAVFVKSLLARAIDGVPSL